MAFDRTLLENARKMVKEKASTLLYDIGSAQWQKEMDSTIAVIMNRGSNQMDDASVPTSLSEEEVRSYVDDISKQVRELHNEKKPK